MNVTTDCPCSVNEAELFDPIQKQVVLDRAQWVDIYPVNNISTDGPIEFEIKGSTDEFLDLNNTMLQVQAKIVNSAANANLIANDVIAPVNNWLHSMFSDAMVTIHETVVEGGDHHYPFKAYLSNLLMHNYGSKNTQLAASGWYKDTASKMNVATDNAGFKSRKDLTSGSKLIEMCGPLILDIMMQNKYLLQNTDVNIKLTQSKPEFQVMIKTGDGVAGKATSVRVILTKAILHVRRVKALASHMNLIEEKLNLQNVIYPIQRTELVTYTIPTGSQSHTKQSLFRSVLPKAVFIAFVDNAAFNGSYTENPFNFDHFDVNHLALYRAGESIPFRPFKPDFDNGLVMREYMSLFQSLGMYNTPDDFDVSLNEFKNGYSIFGFNLTPDLSIGGHAQVSRDDYVRIEAQFKQALTKTINVIVMGVFDGRIEITKQRNVLCDWKS